MRCGCPQCGEYMVQQEKGLDSGCKCIQCGYECTACMGGDKPLSRSELSELYGEKTETN